MDFVCIQHSNIGSGGSRNVFVLFIRGIVWWLTRYLSSVNGDLDYMGI